MDQQKLRTLVFEKTGVRIDVDDPVFALVALNEAVLAEAVERHVALLDEATAELAERLREGGFSVRAAAPERQPAALLKPAGASAQGFSPSLAEKRMAGLAAAAAVLGALLVLLGQAMFFKNLPAPALQAGQLSEAQASALHNAEKLEKIVQKLDPKTRDKIRAELQQP